MVVVPTRLNAIDRPKEYDHQQSIIVLKATKAFKLKAIASKRNVSLASHALNALDPNDEAIESGENEPWRRGYLLVKEIMVHPLS